MPDQVLTQLVSAASAAVTTTTVNFTAQANGTLLVLVVVSDAYTATAGGSRPESTGFTKVQDRRHNAGHALWYKITTGSDTSVQYTLDSAAISVHWLGAATNVHTTTPLDTSNGNDNLTSGTTQATPAITPATGRKLLVGSIGGCKFDGPPHITGQSTWLNSYTEIGDQTTSSGSTSDSVGVSWIVLDGGTSTSTGSTYSNTSTGRSGIIASFTNAPAGAAVLPILMMPARS